jgi:hypothetical protein
VTIPRDTLHSIRTLAGYLPVTMQQVSFESDLRPVHGPTAPPVYGPAMPTLTDQYEWLASQLDDVLPLDPWLAGLMRDAVADAIEYSEHECDW